MRAGLPVAVIGMLWLSPVTAQSDDPTIAIDIPAQPLASALNSLALQANLQMLFEQAPVSGLNAPAVVGSLTAQQALHALLANTDLEFVQNADGTIVVRPKATATARRRTRPKPAARPTAVAASPTPAAIESQSVQEMQAPWALRLRAAYLDPRDRSDALTLPGTLPGFMPADGTRTNGRWTADLVAEYFLSSHWSGELMLSLPRLHDLGMRSPTLGDGTVGNFRLMPNFVTAKYNFNPDGLLRPYVGVGLNVTSFYGVNAGQLGLSKTTTGPAAQAGLDVLLSEHWALNADIKWARVRPAISVDGQPLGHMHLDPLLFGIGIAYRFGSSSMPFTPVAAQPSPLAPTPTPVAQPAPAAPPPDSDGDGVPDPLDRCPGTPAGLQVDAQGCEIEELVLKGVRFETNSAVLAAQSSQVLDEVVQVLKQRPTAKAQIHGYTDSRGADTLNQKLSERRAGAVAAYLIAHGIASDNLTARGFGKANPVAGNDTAEGRAQNRRVTVEFSSSLRR